ncbi:MAG: hypothetical protein KF729_09690 [Sandaracinaceae bacterium]|nr:hypothetical protein [Sandaracinaceae bacterium]
MQSRPWVMGLGALGGLAALLASPAGAQDRWVVMVYVAADNDLEPELVDQVRALVRAGTDPNVELLIQMDRQNGWKGDGEELGLPGLAGYTAGTRRFRVRAGSAEDVVNVGRVDSGSANQLQSFLGWALESARSTPAGTAHGLILLGPGSGYRGALQDTSLRTASSMTARQIQTAISAAYDANETWDERNLQLLAVGASLFGTIENAAALSGGSPSANLRLVLSEDVFPSSGFDFTRWMGTFGASGADLSPRVVAQQLAASVSMDEEERVIAVVVPALVRSAMEQLELMAIAFDASRHGEAVAQARAMTQRFGVGAVSDPYGLIDLRRFLRHLDERLREDGTSWDDRLPDDARDAVEYLQRGEARHETGGLSVYLPERDALPGNPAAQVGEQWARFVASYASAAQADRTPPMVAMVAAEEEEAEELPEGSGGGGLMRRVRVRANTVGGDIDQVTIALGVPFEGGVAFLGELPLDQGGGAEGSFDGGPIDFTWDGTWIGVQERGSEYVDPAAFFFLDRYTTESGQTRAIYVVPAAFDDGYGDVDDFEDGLLVFDVDPATLTGRLAAVLALDDSATDSDGIYEVELGPDAVLIPLIAVVGDDGSFDFVDGYPVRAAGLTPAPFCVEDGVYELGIRAIDLRGNDAIELLTVTLGGAAGGSSGGCAVGGRERVTGAGLWALGLALFGLGALARRRHRRAGLVALATTLALGACDGGGGADAGVRRDARVAVFDGGCPDDDGDGVCDRDDECWGYPDADDADRDGVPDGCDCDASGDACSANATCDDGMDGVICNCSPGFVGDGETCSREGLDAGTPLDAGPDFDGGPLDGGPPDPGAVALLVDPSSTRATLLYATADGRVRSSAATTGAEIGRWTYATGMVDPSTDTAHVLFYDLAGGGRYVAIDLETRAVTVLMNAISLSGGWDAIVPVGCDGSCDRYVFFDADTNLAAVLELRETGGVWSTAQTDTATFPGAPYDHAWRMAWDVTGASALGLYRASDGAFARVAIARSGADRGRFARAGAAIDVVSLGSGASGIDVVTPLAEAGHLGAAGLSDQVLAYDTNGSARIERLTPGAVSTRTSWPAASFAAWQHIVTLENGVTLFYQDSAGSNVAGRFQLGATPPSYSNTDTYTVGAGFAHVTPLITRHP